MDLEQIVEVRSAEGLYGHHQTSLVRFATALVGPDDAADVVSDAMESLLRGGQLETARSPVALMHTAVIAKARSMQRSVFARRARERRFAERWIEEQPDAQPEVVQALVRLSPQQRGCVYLTYWEDLTPAAVGAYLGIGEGSVKRQLARARSKLREVLNA